MEPKYNHKLVEKNKNQKWIDRESFSTHDQTKKTFTIILPPPNITGKLHLGHAWDCIIQDALIRYHKLNGKDVLWVPGIDHAGIATQAKVEVQLQKQTGQTKHDLGRKQFLKEVWKWKEEYAQIIRRQWGELGLALDYKKERFTMDEGFSQEVTKIFIKMYQDDLIYQGKKAINWDPKLQTVLSNIEVENKEIVQPMFYFKYPIKNSQDFIEVATTRPETMFSDVAIAVNPCNKKLSNLIGQTAVSPLTNLDLPIIGDDYIKVDKGTGVMKVSAHASIDIEIILKNNLKIKESIDSHGKMNQNAFDMEGLSIFNARTQVVSLLKAKGFFLKKEEQNSTVGYSSRSGAVIETLVSLQWFVRMKPFANKILQDLKLSSGVNFYPSRFKNDLQKWMEEIHDWCISRQLWWGHRIPVWYKKKQTKVQEESPGEDWKQDEDVIDTWFSSGLAPFLFLGGINSPDYQKYYPTNVLVTGYDLIFFWVSRMYFQSLEITNQKPFYDVLIHGLIRTEDGQKMSKSLGNGINPKDVIDKYGVDALRWFLLTNSTPGQDIRYSEQKIMASWNLNNKLWNISRFIINIMEDKESKILDADKWISTKLSNLEKLVDVKMQKYNFTIIGKKLTEFIVEDLSSWYIEFSKTSPNKKFAVNILKRLLQLLHPFLPFITDHIFNLIDNKEILDFNRTNVVPFDNITHIDRVIVVVKALRQFRKEHNISNKVELYFEPTTTMLSTELKMIKKLAFVSLKPNQDALIVLENFNIYVELSDNMKKTEQTRVAKQINFVISEIERAQKILANQNFISKAPQHKIKLEKTKLAKFKKELKELQSKHQGD